ncbi:MAG TPA: ABC transporter permease [Terriglobales bacterium]|nr:ABC transporter permease [Terriglobales bacterium]
MSFEQWLYTVPLRLRSLFFRKRVDQELSDELRDHIELQTQENIARGMSPEAAGYAALRALGGVTQVEEECREKRGVNMLEDFIQDLRYGLRQLRRSPGFFVLALSCLTLGIGANTAVFSWIEGTLFRPYPAVAHQERLVAIGGTSPGEEQGGPLSWPDYLDLQRGCTLCETTFVTKITGGTLSIGERAEVTTGSIVSANYFEAIGVHPILGRGFRPGEDVGRNSHPIIVISYQLWQSRFKGDPQIIGKTQRLNSEVYTIVGVTPKDFYGTFVGWAMNFWVPASMEENFEAGGYKLEDRGARWIECYAKLKPGVSRQQAQQEVSALARRLEAAYPATNRGRGIKLWPLWQTPFNDASTLLPTLKIMFWVAGSVLLIACANVGNLLLVRSFSRRREINVRLALGAGYGRLLRQLLTEALMVSVLGATCGLLVAYWCRHALVLLFPVRSGIAMHLPGEIDWRVLSLSVAICILTAAIVGLVPALETRNLDVSGALKADSPSVTRGRGRAWVRSSLVIVQVCLSFVLLVGTVLLLRSLDKIRNTSPGFLTTRVLTTRVSIGAAGYSEPQAKTFQDELLDRVWSLPGVEAAAFARITPLGYISYSSTPIAVDGYQPRPGEQPSVDYNQVSPDYFATLGIRLISGREFTRADDENAPLVAVVNQTMVARYWRGQSPIGRRLQVKGSWVRVVGVAANSKYESMREIPRPFFYVPLRQDFAKSPDLNIRTTQPLRTIATALSQEVHALDPNLALYEMITLQEQVDRSTSPQLVAVTLVAILGGLALVLAAVGIYGVMSYTVSQSTRELGLRMALGAGASNLLRVVISRGLALTAIGILIGTAAALALTRLMGDLLYNVSPYDPRAFGLALAVMTSATITACLWPAWHATRIDPARVLRE